MAARTSARASGIRCSECGWTTVTWVGRCGECQAWGSVSELGAVAVRTTAATRVERPAVPIGQVDARRAEAVSTGVGEFDRVLGGGLVPGAVVLVAGEPGIGKSTLLLDVAARAARSGNGRTVLYVTGEESAAQVRMRAERIEAMAASLFLAAETDLATVLGQIDAVQPDLVIVDSVQTIASGDVEGAAGNVTQVREVAASLIQVAKSRGIATLLVGHVTKDGSIAGPRVLEHLVDVVVQFEGDRHSQLRLVRAVKNRYGPTDEVGCFELSDTGMTGLQALVAKSEIPTPRRATSGLDSARVAMIIAVLAKRAGAPIGSSDVYLSTVGGVRLTKPASDLAIALAVASSVMERPLKENSIAFGELGLAGELRPVGGIPRRLAEAARLGFRTAYVPSGVLSQGQVPTGMHVVECPDIRTAVHSALQPAHG